MTESEIKLMLVTAAQIAEELNLTAHAVRKRLAAMPKFKAAIDGRQATFWNLADLPAEWRFRIETIAKNRGYADGKSFMADSNRRWQPPVPSARIDKGCFEQAILLREALNAPIERRNTLGQSELTALGLAEYKRVFGHSIIEKNWQAIFDRTIQRDRGAENFTRVEIYLDNAAFDRPVANKTALQLRHLHLPLQDQIKNLENKIDPTQADLEFLFHAAFIHFENLTEEEPNFREVRQIKKSLVSFLRGAIPTLAKSETSLRKQFDRRMKKWIKGGRSHGSLQDMRHLASGNFRRPDFSADEEKIRDMAIVYGGSESLAHRQLRKRGGLSEEFTEYYSFNMRRNKSYVPKTVRAAITPKVDMCGPIYRGPWQARMAGPYIPRDWSGVLAGEFISGDDTTLNHYVWDPENLNGDGRPWIGRGEWLLLNDVRTGYPLHFVFIPGHYSGQHIRSALLKIHDDLGLGRKGLYFENSIWASRWIPGERRKHWLHWRETEVGLSELGFEFEVRHARTPRAKPIESLFHILQDRMRSEPGFCEFNERTVKMERMQDFLARARRGTEDPRNELLTVKQWTARITSILEEFAHEPQNGKMLPGVSPAEMWEDGLSKLPLRKLPDERRFLLGTHCEPRPVTQRGILIPGVKDYLYANEETGNRIGEQVLAFYNVDHPQLLTVSDLTRQNYFTVKGIKLKAMSASNEEQKEIHRQIRGHMAPAKAIYGSIQHRVISTITRDDEHDSATKELGEFHNAEVRKYEEEQSSGSRKLGEIQKAAAVGSVTVGADVRNPDRVLTGIEKEKEFRERIARKSQPKHSTGPQVV